MGAGKVDLDWITPLLAVGGCYPSEAAEHLARAHGVRHVVDVRGEDRDDEHVLRRHGVELLHLPTEDRRAVSLAMLDEGVAWVTARLVRGERVYIHCQYGIGRSALLALCVLVASGDAPLQALRRAKAARRKISPSPEQLEAFRAWLAARAARDGDVPVPAAEELFRIAYSHLRQGELGTGAPAG